FYRLNRIALVVNGAGRARQVVDLVHLDEERKGDVVANELEIRVIQQVHDVRLVAREEVVGTQHLVSGLQQPVAQVASEESGTAGDQYTLSHQIPQLPLGRVLV